MDEADPPAPLRAAPWVDAVTRSVRLGALGTASLLVAISLAEGLHPFAPLVLGAAAGGLMGLVLGVLAALSRHQHRRVRVATFMVSGVLTGLWLAYAIGAFLKLSGSRAALAWLAIVAGVCGGAALGALVSCARLDRAELRGLSRRRRVLVAFLALGGALGLALAVENMLVLVGYPVAQHALSASSWVLALVALRFVDPWPRLPERARPALAVALTLATGAGVIGYAGAPTSALTPLLGSAELSLPMVLAWRLTDADGDGSSALYGGGDCAPFDPDVHPGAREVPGNGVDDNCLAGDAPLADSSPANPLSTAPELAPNHHAVSSVVLITIDALRPDHTTPYGYARDTTPQLARFAAGSRRFTRATTAGGFTSLALSAMMRGVYPRHITWNRAFETSRGRLLADADAPLQPRESWNGMVTLPLADTHPALPALLTARGIHTLAVVDDGPSSFLAQESGLAPGFETYVLVTPHGPAENGDDAVAREVATRLPELRTPFFLWVHLFGPHMPDEDHPGERDFGDTELDRYDEDVAHADAALGRVLEAVAQRQRRLATPPTVLISADHGEVFGGGMRGHGLDLFEVSVAVPLLVRGADFAVGVDNAPVSLVDIMPTVLRLTGTPEPASLDGVDLRSPRAGRVVFTDLWRFDAAGALTLDLASATDSRHHLIYDLGRAGALLNRVGDLGRPPREVHASEPRDDLERALNAYLESTGGRPRLVDSAE